MTKIEQLERLIDEIVTPMGLSLCRLAAGGPRVMWAEGRDEVVGFVNAPGNWIGCCAVHLTGEQLNGDSVHWSPIVLDQINFSRRQWAAKMRELADRLEQP